MDRTFRPVVPDGVRSPAITRGSRRPGSHDCQTRQQLAGTSGSPDHAVANAILLAAALGWGLSLALSARKADLAALGALVKPVDPGRLSGAGRAADPGPFRRREGSLGELVWLTGGLLLWLLDLVGALQGQARSLNWTTPLGERTMGLVILAVLLAGWKCGLAGRNWSWTNVTGWALGLFWVALAAGSWLLTPSSGLASIVAR